MVFENAVGFRLGTKGQGFRAMLDLMNNARLGVAAQGIGIAAAALHDATHYARTREQFGQPIDKQPLVLSMLAKMTTNIEAARALLYRTFALLDQNVARDAALRRGDLAPGDAERMRTSLEHDQVLLRLLTPLCKYYATEICHDVTRDAMQVYGGIGYTMDADVAKLHADSLIMTVYEGTSEIQASFALREMGKGALGVALAQMKDELGAMASDAKRAELAKLVDTSLGAHPGLRAGALHRPALRAAARQDDRGDGDQREGRHRAAVPGRRRRRAARSRRGLRPAPRDRERVDGEAHRAEPRRPPRTRRADPRELRASEG